MVVISKTYLQESKNDPSGPLNGHVLEINSLLAPILSAGPDEPTLPTMVWNTLVSKYSSGSVSPLQTGDPIYLWVWDPVELCWHKYCTTSQSITVTFSATEHVIVDIAVGVDYVIPVGGTQAATLSAPAPRRQLVPPLETT